MPTVDENSDLVWGAAEIGRVIGRPARITFYLLEKGILPGRKLGGRWVVSRKALLPAVIGEEQAS